MQDKILSKQQVSSESVNAAAETSDSLSKALVDFLSDDWLNKIQSLDIPANIE